MGGPMARNVLGSAHVLSVYDIARSSTERLVQLGAIDAASPADAASGADVVMLSLPGPAEVLDAIVGSDGVLDAVRPPTFVVDLSTNSPATVAELARACAARDVTFVDAPVSGGLTKARSGTLTVLVGASPAVFARVQPVLETIGSEVVLVGPTGSGTVAKLVNNLLFLAGAVAVQEAFVLGAKLGMAPSELDAIIAASSAAPYAKLAPLLLGRAFDDVIFRLDIAAKDLRLAIEAADGAGVDLPLTRSASDVYSAAEGNGDGHLAFHATLRELERRAGIALPPLLRTGPAAR